MKTIAAVVAGLVCVSHANAADFGAPIPLEKRVEALEQKVAALEAKLGIPTKVEAKPTYASVHQRVLAGERFAAVAVGVPSSAGELAIDNPVGLTPGVYEFWLDGKRPAMRLLSEAIARPAAAVRVLTQPLLPAVSSGCYYDQFGRKICPINGQPIR